MPISANSFTVYVAKNQAAFETTSSYVHGIKCITLYLYMMKI